MKKSMQLYILSLIISFSILLNFPPSAYAAGAEQMKLPPARKIPGITSEDKFPNGCVDCHINMPDINQDERISTLMSKWNKKVAPKLLGKAQAVTPAGVTLKGIHKLEPASLKDIPAACISCHDDKSKKAPPFGAMLHAVHLTGGDENHFLAIFQGECTHCHKMNPAKGVWTMPSGSEK